MIEDKNKILNPVMIIKKSYQNIFDHFKSYFLLSYVILLPTFIYQYISPLKIDPKATPFLEVFPRPIFTLIILIILSIFLYRLFILGRDNCFKLTPKNLLDIFNKFFLYTIALAIVLLLALMSIGLLFALVLTVINSVVGENATDTVIISSIVWIIMSLFLLLIVFRTLPTFTSIAIGDKLIAMKSAYYYTRNNNKNFIIIAIACYLPMTMISAFFAYILSNSCIEENSINSIIAFVLLPLSIMPYALQLSAGVEIYKELVPMEKYTKMQKTDMMV
jgi:hypothetical protein